MNLFQVHNFQDADHPLFARICFAHKNLVPYHSEKVICWEDPDQPESPMKITKPASEWLAMALNGFCLPPVSVYSQLQFGCFSGNETLPWKIYSDEYDAIKHCEDYPDNRYQIVNGKILHASVIPPLTEKEAFTYIIMKDIPKRVWAEKRNRSYLRIVPADVIRKLDPTVRDAWRLNDRGGIDD